MAIIINSPKIFCVNVVLGRRNQFEFTLQEENFHWNLNFAIWLLANLLNLNSASIRFFNIYINDSWYNWNSKIKIRWYLIPWTISTLFSPFFVNGKLITKRWTREVYQTFWAVNGFYLIPVFMHMWIVSMWKVSMHILIYSRQIRPAHQKIRCSIIQLANLLEPPAPQTICPCLNLASPTLLDEWDDDKSGKWHVPTKPESSDYI